MLQGSFVLFIMVCAVWVYLDATKHQIGKVKDKGGFFNLSAGAWGTVTLLFWIIGFPAYLIKRKALIERAQEHPVAGKGRIPKALAFVVIGCAWAGLIAADAAQSGLPGCDDTITQDLLEQIVNDMPLVQSSGARYVSVEDIVESGYNERAQLRSCKAVLVTTAGEDNLQYSINWQNQDKGEFYVEAQIQ